MASEVTKATSPIAQISSLIALEPLEEAEIIAVVPPPAEPKRSLPPPPKSKPAPHLSPTLSPLVRKLETAAAFSNQVEDPIPELLVELPDTSIPRPIVEKKISLTPLRAPVDDVTVLVADDVVWTPGGSRIDYTDFEQIVGGPVGLGAQLEQEYKQLQAKKRRDPAVMIEIPSTPSAQAYEVAHTNKLEDQYFNPIYVDQGGDGTESPIPPPPPPPPPTASFDAVFLAPEEAAAVIAAATASKESEAERVTENKNDPTATAVVVGAVAKEKETEPATAASTAEEKVVLVPRESATAVEPGKSEQVVEVTPDKEKEGGKEKEKENEARAETATTTATG